jgi:hypothetical protein
MSQGFFPVLSLCILLPSFLKINFTKEFSQFLSVILLPNFVSFVCYFNDFYFLIYFSVFVFTLLQFFFIFEFRCFNILRGQVPLLKDINL